MQDNFSRIVREELPRYAPKRQFPDDADPDPYVRGPHQMGPTQSRRPGNFQTQNPAVDSDTDDEVVVLEVFCVFLHLIFFSCVASHSAATNAQVHEHVAPLAAEVRQEFLDTLAQGGQAPKHRKNKAPAENAGPSRALPTKRQKKGSLGPYGRKRRHEMPTAAG
jgi:hypothetical protein